VTVLAIALPLKCFIYYTNYATSAESGVVEGIPCDLAKSSHFSVDLA
jgi:hypothetical protein